MFYIALVRLDLVRGIRIIRILTQNFFGEIFFKELLNKVKRERGEVVESFAIRF
jgi:hypothetical protein